MNRYIPLLALILLPYLSFAQGDSTKDKGDSTKGIMKNFKLHEFKSGHVFDKPTPDPHVPDSEVACITYDFTQQFKLGPLSSPTAIPIAPMEFTRASFEQAVTDAGCPADSTGIVIHFGLTGTNKTFDVALEFVCLKAQENDSFDYVAPEVHYTISNSALVRKTGGVSTWKNNWTNFNTNVVFMDDLNGTFRKYAKAKDVEYVVFPVTEIQALIADNDMQNTDKLKLRPTAEPTEETNKAFRQGMVWIPMNVTLDGETYSGKPFKFKGADLGSPCPRNCPPKIKFLTSGAAVRPNCP